MKSILTKLAAVTFAGLFAIHAFAAAQGTRDEAIALVHKVQERMKNDGRDKTFEAINDKAFNDRDLYPFVIEFGGALVADGLSKALVGKNLLNLKDPDGKSPGEEMLAVAKSGKPGWVNYSWPNPTTKKIEAKSVYIERVDDADLLIAVSVYQ
jgi:signal transduction histidine kinase